MKHKGLQFILSLLAAVSFIHTAPAAAQDTAPDVMVKKVSDKVLDIIRSEPDLKTGSIDAVVKKIEPVVLPHFDFRRMTMLAVGRDWRQASETQRQQLQDQFYTLLVRTYSNALRQYSNQTLTFKPLRMAKGDTTVRVQSEIRQSGSEPIQLDYVLELQNGEWKVFDVVVAGVSLVTNYRNTFAQTVSRSGIDGLIKSLQERNAALAQGKDPDTAQ